MEEELRRLKMYKALLLLQRRGIERLIARVDGATVELMGQQREPRRLDRREPGAAGR